jgi:hypothetical protein
MKTALKIATVLTWFNIIVWGGIVAFGLLGMLITAQMPLLAGFVLMSSIPLNCYAALKLQSSIRHPNIPLSHQTPVGIRFVGLMAMFFGFTDIASGVSIIAKPREMMDAMKEMAANIGGPAPAEIAAMGKTLVVVGGLATIFLGLVVVVNVILNLRLLRWFYLVQKSDVS